MLGCPDKNQINKQHRRRIIKHAVPQSVEFTYRYINYADLVNSYRWTGPFISGTESTRNRSKKYRFTFMAARCGRQINSR